MVTALQVVMEVTTAADLPGTFMETLPAEEVAPPRSFKEPFHFSLPEGVEVRVRVLGPRVTVATPIRRVVPRQQEGPAGTQEYRLAMDLAA